MLHARHQSFSCVGNLSNKRHTSQYAHHNPRAKTLILNTLIFQNPNFRNPNCQNPNPQNLKTLILSVPRSTPPLRLPSSRPTSSARVLFLSITCSQRPTRLWRPYPGCLSPQPPSHRSTSSRPLEREQGRGRGTHRREGQVLTKSTTHSVMRPIDLAPLGQG